MTYSDQEFLVNKIRSQYTEREMTQLDALKALDRKVKRPPTVFAYVFGSLAAIVMGSGMSLVMTEIGAMLNIAEPMIHGIAIGVVGLFCALINYPIYKKRMAARRKKYAEKIVALSDAIVNGEEK